MSKRWRSFLILLGHSPIRSWGGWFCIATYCVRRSPGVRRLAGSLPPFWRRASVHVAKVSWDSRMWWSSGRENGMVCSHGSQRHMATCCSFQHNTLLKGAVTEVIVEPQPETCCPFRVHWIQGTHAFIHRQSPCLHIVCEDQVRWINLWCFVKQVLTLGCINGY
ncbi:hypothetical protein M408DRAFT_178546 [Serendipita vermifera MAFF 305830]|uniref:Secreted protein n=1 Tax=Serendipita vermifera MAFF 305830 TaxID=933852 RepID=A0A0C3A532_SERVB|nr:hypothetical protein M408DRAFT_178546 [Serendipita vermifera MAFF 305830]